ncbi:MAG TPA: hypothetical protein VFV50_04550 [Bdellovibrionales bacterium]|nr:hypothetical protein [Bdellovibrionales bacterium]
MKSINKLAVVLAVLCTSISQTSFGAQGRNEDECRLNLIKETLGKSPYKDLEIESVEKHLGWDFKVGPWGAPANFFHFNAKDRFGSRFRGRMLPSIRELQKSYDSSTGEYQRLLSCTIVFFNDFELTKEPGGQPLSWNWLRGEAFPNLDDSISANGWRECVSAFVRPELEKLPLELMIADIKWVPMRSYKVDLIDRHGNSFNTSVSLNVTRKFQVYNPDNGQFTTEVRCARIPHQGEALPIYNERGDKAEFIGNQILFKKSR